MHPRLLRTGLLVAAGLALGVAVSLAGLSGSLFQARANNVAGLHAALDCDATAPGIQDVCMIANGTPAVDVVVTIANHSTEPVSTLGSFNFDVVVDQTKFNPQPAGGDNNFNSNPDANEALFATGGTWTCGLPAPNPDTEPADPNVARSNLTCYISSATGAPFPAGHTELGRVHYNVVGSNTSALFTMENVNVTDESLAEVIACPDNVAIGTPCFPATIGIGVNPPTSTPIGGPPTALPTDTPVSTSTATSTATGTATSTATGTSTATPTSTDIAVATATFTSAPTDTATATPTVTETPTEGPTQTPTGTATASSTATSTATATATGTATGTPTPTGTPTEGPSPTATETLTVPDTPTPTVTSTLTGTPFPTDTPADTPVPTDTPLPTETATPAPPTTTPTAPAGECAANVDGDDDVDVRDLMMVARHLGKKHQDLDFDVNGDERVDHLDLIAVVRALGAEC